MTISNNTPRIAQGKFNQISQVQGEWCFHFVSGEHDLEKNDLVEITFVKQKDEFKALYYVGSQIDTQNFGSFTIQDDLMLDEDKKVALGITPNSMSNVIGYWSKVHSYELSISKCDEILVELGCKWNSNYHKLLYRIQEARIFKSGKAPQICNEEYLHTTLNIPFKEISKMDLFDIEKMNNLLGNIHRSFVNFDSRVVQFDDNYILHHEEYKTPYFQFLCLLLCNTPIYDIDDVLNYHSKKHRDNITFSNKLGDYFLELEDDVKDYKIVSKVDKWINSQINSQIQPTNENIIHSKLEIKPVFRPELINSIFELLKDFFSIAHQNALRGLLDSGTIASEPLVFLDNGNRLADAFKQLIKSDIITGCKQKDLEGWICLNFKYRYRNEIKTYTPRYLQDIISSNGDLCRNPILNVKKDKSTGTIQILRA